MKQRKWLSDNQTDIWQRLVEIPTWVNLARGTALETPAAQYLADKLSKSGCQLHLQEFAPGRKQLIAVKGSGTQFVLYLTCHLDTVPQNIVQKHPGGLVEHLPPHKLTIGKKQAWGLGARDMKLGAAGIVDIMERMDIPPWMTVVAAFLGDEEYESLGANHFIQQIKRNNFPKPDLIFSPEISTVPEVMYPSDVIPVTDERRGHQKSIVRALTQPSHAGLDAPDAMTELIHLVSKSFDEYKKVLTNEGPIQSDTELASKVRKESWRVKEREPDREYQNHGLSVTSLAELDVRIMFCHPKDLDHVLITQKECFQRVASQLDLAKRGIRYSFEADRTKTSYQPYKMDARSRGRSIVTRAVATAYAPLQMRPSFMPDGSTSDSNLFAAQGWEVFEQTAKGGGQHTPEEYVDLRTAAASFKTMEELVSGRAIQNSSDS